MVDVKISELPVAPSATTTDQLEANQAGTSRSITVAQVGTALALSTTYAPLASPVFTGDPQAPTPATADNDTSISTTAFVKAQGYQTAAQVTTSLGSYLPLTGGTLAGPGTLTGTTATFSGTTTMGGAMVGYGTAVPFFSIGSSNTPIVQVSSTGFTGFSVQRYAAGTAGPAINLSHSKAAVLGTQTIVAASDFLGQLSFNGSDGVKFIEGANIVAQVDGTPGVDDMPTRLIFNTTSDGAATPTEAMRIASNNAVTLAGSLTGTTANFSGTVSAPGAQIQMVSVVTGAVATGTTVIPLDDTIPQIAEGDQYMTLAITPKSATSKLVIEVTVVLSHSVVSVLLGAALFQDATANALAGAFQTTVATAAQPITLSFRHVMTSGTTSATTFRVRGGSGSVGTTTFNGSGGARFWGGVLASSIVIREVA